MKKSIQDYKVGDQIFRHVEGGGTFEYIVKCVREYENERQLEVECQPCKHGYKCLVLLAQNDSGGIVSVHMLNNAEGDDQSYWHSNDGLHFWPTHEEAREEGLQLLARRVRDRISQKERGLEQEREHLKRIEAAIGGLQP